MIPVLNLPSELVQHIFEFCIDKRLFWDKLNQQFLKGGFNRKNLKLNKYLEKERWCAKKIWESTRPEMWGIHKFYYRYGEWDIKKKYVVVTCKTRRGLVNKWSAKDPVSRWLKNIKKFETSYPEFAKEAYLPDNPSPIKIKGVSKFYIDLRAKNKKKRKKEKETKAASLFMAERKQLKLNKCNFKKNQEVLLSFTMPSGKLKFYRGWVSQIYLHQHRGGNGYRKIFSAPRGKNRFDTLNVDNYIGEVKISVRFEDYDYRCYSNERLVQRIQTSAKEKITQEENITLPIIEIGGKNYFHDPHGDYGGIKDLILSMNGTPLGIYDKDNNTVIIHEFEE